MNKDLLADLVVLGGFKFSDTFVPYTSGKIGDLYIQSLVVTRDGLAYRRAVNSLIGLISDTVGDNFSVITGGETKDWDFSNPVAYAMAKPHAKLYKGRGVLGADIKGKKVIHVADMNNQGYSLSHQWIPQIRGFEGEIRNCFFYIDRMEGGRRPIKDLGVESHAVIELDEMAWDYLRAHEDVTGITEEIYRNIMERRKDPEEWAKRMLRSDKGFAELKRLYNNPRTNNKALKILDVGYPELKDELMERLNDR